MTTLAAGSSYSFTMDPHAKLTLVVSGKATLSFTSDADNLRSDFTVSNAQSKTYGPFGAIGTMVITAVDKSLDYTVTPGVPMLSSDGLSLVSGDGTTFLSLGGDVTGATQNEISLATQRVLTDGVYATTGPGVQLVQPDGTNAYMVATDAYQQTEKACTVTWSSGNTASVVVTGGHGCVESDAFVLQVATPASDAKWAEVFRAGTITDANTLTFSIPFRPTAGPVGVVTFRRCTRNVVIDLDLDYNYAGNVAAGSNPNRMAVALAFLADSTVRIRGENVYKYLVLAAGCDNVHFDVGSMPNARSDTFKLYGPSNNNTIRVFGQASEDCVSVQALEPAAFIGYMPCKGNVRNTRIRGMSARITTAGSGAAVVYGDDTYSVSGTVIEDGEAWALAGTGDGFSIKPGTGFTVTQQNVPDVTLRNLDISSYGGDSISVRCPVGRLLLENVNVRAPNATNTRGIYILSAIDTLEFNGCNWLLENWTPGAGVAFISSIARVKTMRFNSCRLRGAASANALRLILFAAGTSQCEYLEFNNCEIADMDVLARFESTMTSTPPTMVINGGVISNVLTVANFRKTGGKLMLNGPTISGATNGVCRSEGAAVVTDVIGFANLATPSQLAVGVSSGLVNLKTPYMSFSHTASVLNNADGNEFITSTAAGTLTVGMPVIGDGALWRCRRDFTKTS